MTAKLFAEMMNLQNKIKSFPSVDYKIPFNDVSKIEEKDKQNFRVYKQLRFKKTRQTDISEYFK